jgi:hypothetical protein
MADDSYKFPRLALIMYLCLLKLLIQWFLELKTTDRSLICLGCSDCYGI